MSFHLFENDILFLQRFATIAGHYKGPMDGKWSHAVDEAEQSLNDEYEKIKVRLGSFDPRSETNIATLLPKAQQKCREFMNVAAKLPFQHKILSGTRTYGEQNELYAKGRTTKGPIVTHAKGGRSNHNFGIAWDVGIFDHAVYNTGDTHEQSLVYTQLAASIKNSVEGLEWGGDWHSFKDQPHFQLATGHRDVAEIEQLFENGKVFA
ncbi:M15 family metallopeptidase [Lichenihabitans sp. Uapishka_5]|uniref:M15 family metallopeptidase n=1 Tax=Lichenihabitans sp. Uapishka_5 TaxID=3037302 RepID=UPI0029E81177|nr:M15 family metallopeptidase [Lichenihabitans sp. Uapishka_5]MDX7951838.1 M15 family metallopeptidase [Lichenihabitans sp. Uapishka_5]